jgi:peptide/nickel transport system permease protein
MIRDKPKENIEQELIRDDFSPIRRYLKLIFIPKYQINLSNRSFKRKRSNKKWFKSPLTIIGIIIVFFIFTIAIFDSWLAPYSYKETLIIDFEKEWLPPSAMHPLGTGFGGQDILSTIIYGTRFTLIIAFAAVSISVVFGIVLGLISGFYGGWIDTVLMRLMDIILAFPGLIFAMAILAIWGSSIEKIIIILGIIGIPFYTRLMRVSVLRIKEKEFIQAAKVVGAKNNRIMFQHILPNSIDPVIMSISFDIGRIIISIVILSFLGFGDFQFTVWDERIIHSTYNIFEAPWASFFPSLAIIITSLGFMLFGDGLRDAFDPKS